MRHTVLLLSFIVFSCDSSRVYEDYETIEEGFWHVDSVKKFTFHIADPQKEYNLIATFRNASSYPFYNIYFQYSLTDSLDSIIIQELKEVDIFDPKTGQPYGSGLGDLFDHSFPLIKNHSFPAKGSYNLKLQQFMRMDTLPFILSIGGRVEFATKN